VSEFSPRDLKLPSFAILLHYSFAEIGYAGRAGQTPGKKIYKKFKKFFGMIGLLAVLYSRQAFAGISVGCPQGQQRV
jgi:hypothetical protein